MTNDILIFAEQRDGVLHPAALQIVTPAKALAEKTGAKVVAFVIGDADDALQFLLAGATAVQLGTQNYIDPTSVITILDELTDICESKGLRDISKLTGRLKKWD